jgi:hypothetical protein
MTADMRAKFARLIHESRVYGLNLSIPEDAKVIIKPWSEREEVDKFAESGVDDQV